MLKDVPRTSIVGPEVLEFSTLRPRQRGDGVTCTLNGCFALRATSKYTSPDIETFRSFPVNAVG